MLDDDRWVEVDHALAGGADRRVAGPGRRRSPACVRSGAPLRVVPRAVARRRSNRSVLGFLELSLGEPAGAWRRPFGSAGRTSSCGVRPIRVFPTRWSRGSRRSSHSAGSTTRTRCWRGSRPTAQPALGGARPPSLPRAAAPRTGRSGGGARCRRGGGRQPPRRSVFPWIAGAHCSSPATRFAAGRAPSSRGEARGREGRLLGVGRAALARPRRAGAAPGQPAPAARPRADERRAAGGLPRRRGTDEPRSRGAAIHDGRHRRGASHPHLPQGRCALADGARAPRRRGSLELVDE